MSKLTSGLSVVATQAIVQTLLEQAPKVEVQLFGDNQPSLMGGEERFIANGRVVLTIEVQSYQLAGAALDPTITLAHPRQGLDKALRGKR